MRRAFVAVILVSCGFGAASDATDTPVPTPDENARPPVPGEPLTGIFASSSKGNDGADGSMGKPYKTLKEAIAVAQSTHQKVVACAEEYDEAVEILDAVSMYGYYDCNKSPWEHVATNAVVKSPTSPAMKADGIAHATRVDGFEVFAPDLDAKPYDDVKNASSIGLFVTGSTNLVLGACKIHGGKAAPGPDGVDPAPNKETSTKAGGLPAVAAAHPNGCHTVSCNTFKKVPGPSGGASACAVGAAGGTGGFGGVGLVNDNSCGDPATPELHGLPTTASATTALGGAGNYLGTPGSPGAPGADGANGTNGAWSMTAKGFVPGDGTAAKNGSAGQGGGGGGGSSAYFSDGLCRTFLLAGGGTDPDQTCQTETGGGGGAGGCAGLAGTAGKGGGASFGTLVVNSTLSFENTQISSSDGGRAGKGALGLAGLTGGTGGLATNGKGGNGGTGGSSGISGHGAAGPSFALAFIGSRPTTDQQTQLQPGQGGAGQADLSKLTPTGTRFLAAAPKGESAPEKSF